MNNKIKFSIRESAHKMLVVLRKKLNLKPRYTVAEIARKAGLPVEYLENTPTSFEGFLDWHDEPRFIAVNRDLPAHERALFIARQIALRSHQQRYNSLALDRPWKWAMLDAAPADLKQKITQMDVEYRAHWLMLFWATGDEYRAFIRSKHNRLREHLFADNIIAFHLFKLRVKNWFRKFRNSLALT